jgi:putative tryptophan/tyrosine transport system substrate-binding protein
MHVLNVTDVSQLSEAFEGAKKANSEGLNVFSSPFLASLSKEIIDFAARSRLPTIYQWREHAEAGGLVSYGPSLATMFRQAATWCRGY